MALPCNVLETRKAQAGLRITVLARVEMEELAKGASPGEERLDTPGPVRQQAEESRTGLHRGLACHKH